MGQGDPGLEEDGMNEGRSLRMDSWTNEEPCERSNRRTNEEPAHERRPSTKALLTNEGFQRTKDFDPERRLERRNESINEGPAEPFNLRTKDLRGRTKDFFVSQIGITLYFILYALLYFLCYGYTCNCIVYIILIVKRIRFIIYTLSESEGRS